jgi:protein involved in polysaccharide export with SLBB domain
MKSYRQIVATLTAVVLLGSTQAVAQDAARPDTTAAPSAMATRADLEAALREAKEGSALARVLRQRLTEGDLRAGDRMVLAVEGESALTDTFLVRTGQVLALPQIPNEISVKGVLRSELDQHMTKEIARYIRNPRVDAVALMRVAVLGAVNQPGYYNVPAEMPLADVVMAAGGPAGDAALDKTVVKRSGSELYEREQVKRALARGESLDQMSVNSGDEIVVGRGGGLARALPYIGALTGIIGVTIALTR